MVRNRLHLLSFSPCGGTAEVNRALARDVDADIVEQDCTRAAVAREPFTYGPDDRVFIAFPVYGGRMPRNVEQVFGPVEGCLL